MKHIRGLVLSLLLIAIFSILIPAEAVASSKSSTTANDYGDIKGSWYEKLVSAYGYTEIFSNGDGFFHPDQAITRMEFARLLHKALGININYFAATDIKEYYNDVASSTAGANQLYDLVTCGIIDTKTSFRPTETLKRDEMIHFIMNAFYYVAGNDYAFTQMYHMFEDDADIRSEYSADSQRAYALGLVNGKGNNYLFPADASTRAEAVTIAGRLAELKQKLKSEVTIKASSSQSNGELNLTLTLLNNTNKSITINHSNGQIFDFVFFDKTGKELYRWSQDRMFTMMVVSTKIAPGEEKVFSDSVDAKAYASIKGKIATIKAFLVGTSSDFTINHDGYYLTERLKTE